MRLISKFNLCITIMLSAIYINVAFAKENHLSANLHDTNKLPTVSLFHAAIFDTVCTTKTNYKISTTWEKDLEQQFPHWQALWDQEGTVLMKTTTQVIGRPFAQQNFQVALSLCDFPSMSAPLIVNTRYALKSFTNGPIPDYVFISNIYHEILHNYIDSFLPKNTPLLIQYKNETPGVRNHLHLFALEKAIYLQLKWQSKLNVVIAKDERLPNGDYKRAWEIINKEENYHSFIKELQHFKNGKVLYPDEV